MAVKAAAHKGRLRHECHAAQRQLRERQQLPPSGFRLLGSCLPAAEASQEVQCRPMAARHQLTPCTVQNQRPTVTGLSFSREVVKWQQQHRRSEHWANIANAVQWVSQASEWPDACESHLL